MTNKELIDISKTLGVSSEEFSFYEFAAKYLLNMKLSKKETTESFFSLVEYCTDLKNIEPIKHMFGKSGKDKTGIQNWCRKLKTKRTELEKLSINDLQYVMGYAARIAKIKEGENVVPIKRDNNQSRGNINDRRPSSIYSSGNTNKFGGFMSSVKRKDMNQNKKDKRK